ncbi:hypothetical protein FRC12_002671 [Ceratobasidium sp. 428]|nr:hypothetical protein FRC09_012749 [Ceratobasidium sp. 395]KAG8793458.1 hypothetical protein FRC12_002671 [Ceratobasidium sp. 428]
MGVTEVKTLEEFKKIINSEKPSIFDFWATWCGPCRVISPIFEQLSGRTDGVDFYKVDVDDAADIAQEVGIRAMPTFMIFKNGAKVADLVGANPGGLEALVQKASDSK